MPTIGLKQHIHQHFSPNTLRRFFEGAGFANTEVIVRMNVTQLNLEIIPNSCKSHTQPFAWLSHPA